MPRHPPYTLSILTTFIDHRHGGSLCPAQTTTQGELPFARPTPGFQTHPSGRAGTVQTINNGSIRQKGARRHLRYDSPDGKTKLWVSPRRCRVIQSEHGRSSEKILNLYSL